MGKPSVGGLTSPREEARLQEQGSGGARGGARGWRRAGVVPRGRSQGSHAAGLCDAEQSPVSSPGVWELLPPPPQAPSLLPGSALHM